MKLINDIAELKKGDTVILKDYLTFEAKGYSRVFGDIFNIERWIGPQFRLPLVNS